MIIKLAQVGQVSIIRPGIEVPLTATFGTAGMASLSALQTPTLEVEGVSMYGKLIELVDRDESDEDGKGFWGELRRDNGEPWRVQFRSADTERVLHNSRDRSYLREARSFDERQDDETGSDGRAENWAESS